MPRAKLPVPVGERFGCLVVLGESSSWEGQSFWRCRCDCGTEKDYNAARLRRGEKRACGCQRGRAVKHGHARKGEEHPLYKTWLSMRQRCTLPTHDSFKYYGARGITVCERWRESFEDFLADMGDKPGPEYSLDRIDSDGDYEPDNCKWSTHAEQMRNRRPFVRRKTLEPVGG